MILSVLKAQEESEGCSAQCEGSPEPKGQKPKFNAETKGGVLGV